MFQFDLTLIIHRNFNLPRQELADPVVSPTMTTTMQSFEQRNFTGDRKTPPLDDLSGATIFFHHTT
jgi:hypothetical protein